MKKIFLILLNALLLHTAHSQVDFGIKGGANLSAVRYIAPDNSRARLGINAGVVARIAVAENLFVRPELLYSSKGFGYTAAGFAQKGSLRLNYAVLPLLLDYSPKKGVDLMAGPEFGHLLKAVSKSQGISDNVTGSFRRFDVGFDLGAAYSFDKSFGVEARYNYGFKDLVNAVRVDNTGNAVSQGKDGANSVLQVSIYFWLTQ